LFDCYYFTLSITAAIISDLYLAYSALTLSDVTSHRKKSTVTLPSKLSSATMCLALSDYAFVDRIDSVIILDNSFASAAIRCLILASIVTRPFLLKEARSTFPIQNHSKVPWDGVLIYPGKVP
jgi:hypothetical protein